MTFKYLPIGAVFTFASERKYDYAGARGPWVKVSPRCYRSMDYTARMQVGRIGVNVILGVQGDSSK